jgi:hypothetical protein
MLELFHSIVDMPAPFNMIVLVVMFGCAAGVLTGIAAQIRNYACHRADIGFKRELIDRGLSAEEIEQITRAPARAQSGDDDE